MADPTDLSRRERQIMEIVYGRGQATATEVLAELPDPPTRTSVRTVMRILEDKGHLCHVADGREFVYRPTKPRGQAGRSALRKVLRAFFGDSIEKAMAAHLADRSTTLTAEQARTLKDLIDQARARERR